MIKKLICYFLIIELLFFKSVNASEKKIGLPQLDFSTYPSLIFWSIISLIILYFVMSFIITPRISNIFNNREQNIQNNLMKAKSIKEESDLIIQKLLNEQDEARSSARKLIDETIDETKIILEKKESEISKKLNDKINETMLSLEKEKKIKIKELLENVSIISKMIIKKIANIEVNTNKLDVIIKNSSNEVVKDNENGA
tara:strand:- start:1003 stop:1599 length:597 start_codon:yes stop_codon:yes gene_type:complete